MPRLQEFAVGTRAARARASDQVRPNLSEGEMTPLGFRFMPESSVPVSTSY